VDRGVSERESIEEEELLRRALEKHGREHDCEEARCTINPKGERIPDGPRATRSTLPDEIKELFKKYRGRSI